MKVNIKAVLTIILSMVCGLIAQDFISVTSPVSGDEIMTGTTTAINWDHNISEAEILKIELFDGLVFVDELAITSCSGLYQWDVSIDTNPGTEYMIKVSSQSNPSLYDESEAFEIYSLVSPEMISPQDNEIIYEIPFSFTWEETRGAVWYHLFISSIDDFSGVSGVKVEGTSYDVTENVPVGTYYWAVVSESAEGIITDITNVRSFTKEPSGIENRNSPENFTLLQNYPNPFNPETTVEYTLNEVSDIHISIYNYTGKLVRDLVNERKRSGSYSVAWNGKDNSGRMLNSGIYFIKMVTESDESMIKVNLIK